MTRSMMIRQLLAKYGPDTKPVELAKHLKKEFDVVLKPGAVSSYKSSVLKEDREKTRTWPVPAAWAAASKAMHDATPTVVSIDDVITVKKLTDRLGADNFRKLLDVLS